MLKYVYIVIVALSFSSCLSYPKEVRKSIKDMGDDDQKYRWILIFIKDGNQDLVAKDSLLNYPERYSQRYLKKHPLYITSETKKALWSAQDSLDAQNYHRLRKIIDEHGFPGKKQIGGYSYSMNVVVMLLHFMKYEDEFLPILKKACDEGHLKPKDYARFYDRCCLVNKRPLLYASEYLHPRQCIDDLEKTNAARMEIGLKPVKQRKGCN